MDHGSMDHSGMSHHSGMDMGPARCSMNMLFTWDTTNLCVVFRGWQITSTFSLVWTLLAIVLLTAGYELVRELTRRYETRSQKDVDSLPTNSSNDDDDDYHPAAAAERSSLLHPGGFSARAQQKTKVVKAALYAVQVFYSFFIMLLFMTYNGWIMLAVAVGAFVGYLAFGNASATKTAACH